MYVYIYIYIQITYIKNILLIKFSDIFIRNIFFCYSFIKNISELTKFKRKNKFLYYDIHIMIKIKNLY